MTTIKVKGVQIRARITYADGNQEVTTVDVETIKGRINVSDDMKSAEGYIRSQRRDKQIEKVEILEVDFVQE